MATFDSYKKRIVEAMKSSGIYNRNLSIQIENLATSLWVLSRCREEMSDPEFKVIETKTTRDGEQPIENPIFKVLARTQSDVSRQMRQLMLTVENIVGKPDIPTELDSLVNDIRNFK